MRHVETVNATYYTCDLCDCRLEEHEQCRGCGKDLCWDCGCKWEFDPFTCEAIDLLVCRSCHDKSEKLRPQVEAIRQEAEERLDAMEQEWRRACTE